MQSRLKRRLGGRFRHWGEIPPPRLPEELERLEPRLRNLHESALLRFMMFNTGMRPAGETIPAWSTFGGWMRFLGWVAFPVLVLGGLVFFRGFSSAPGLVIGMAMQIVIWILVITFRPGGWVRLLDLIKMMAAPVPDHASLSLLDTVKPHMADLRLAPLTGADFALAHWGSMLLQSRLWRKHPASALYVCAQLTRMRIESETGWSYYPNMFKHRPEDGLTKAENLELGGGQDKLVGLEGGFVGGDELNLQRDYYDFERRLDYLGDLWSELLDVWRPDHPLEGEIRRAVRPTRFHAELEERVQRADSADQ